MRFCPKCGVTIAREEEFCKEHSPKDDRFDSFKVVMCACGRFFQQNRWFMPNDFEESVLKIAKQEFKGRVNNLQVKEFEEPLKRGRKTTGELVGTFDGKQRSFPFEVRKVECDKCSKLKSYYFTAKLQLRNPREDILDFLHEFMRPLAPKGVGINKVEDSPNGVDLFVTHKSAARKAGLALVEKFGGKFSESEQLFSRNHQTSKNLYRLNVRIEFPKFKLGDVVLVDDRAVLIKGLGKKCSGVDLDSGRKYVFVSGDEDKILLKHETTISKVHPEVEVLHPLTYDSVALSNLSGKYEIDDKVNVVLFEKRVYGV